MTTEADLMSTALHEAGHVIAALALGWDPGSSSVQLVGDSWKGSTGCSPTDPDRFGAAIVGCAGVLAEGRLSYQMPPEGAESDMAWVWTAAADLNRERRPGAGDDPKDSLAYVAVAAGLASRLLAESWEDVQKVAVELVANKSVSNLSSLVDVDVVRARWQALIVG